MKTSWALICKHLTAVRKHKKCKFVFIICFQFGQGAMSIGQGAREFGDRAQDSSKGRVRNSKGRAKHPQKCASRAGTPNTTQLKTELFLAELRRRDGRQAVRSRSGGRHRPTPAQGDEEDGQAEDQAAVEGEGVHARLQLQPSHAHQVRCARVRKPAVRRFFPDLHVFSFSFFPVFGSFVVFYALCLYCANQDILLLLLTEVAVLWGSVAFRAASGFRSIDGGACILPMDSC